MEILQSYLDACHRQSIPKSSVLYEELMAAVHSGYFAPAEMNTSLLPVLELMNLRYLNLAGVSLKPQLLSYMVLKLSHSLEHLDLENTGLTFSEQNLAQLRLRSLNLSGNAITAALQLPQTLEVLYVRGTRVSSANLAKMLHVGLLQLDCSDNRLRQDFSLLAVSFVYVGLRIAILRNCQLDRKCITQLRQKMWTMLDVSGNDCVSAKMLSEVSDANVEGLLSLLQ